MNEALAGIAAGSVTALLLAPLDVTKTRMQVQSTIALPKELRARNAIDCLRLIYRTEGVRGLFRGYAAASLTIPLFWSVYFPAYKAFKHQIAFQVDRWAPSRHHGTVFNWQSLVTHSSAAVGAAVIADLITNPLWVVRTRLQTQHMHQVANDIMMHGKAVTVEQRYTGLADAFTKIIRTEGVRALFKGLVVSWLGAIHTAIQFPLYEILKQPLTAAGRGAQSAAGTSRKEDRLPWSELQQQSQFDSSVVVGPVDPATFITDMPLTAAIPPEDDDVTEAGPTGVMGARKRRSPAAAPIVDPDWEQPLRYMFASAASKVVASACTYPHEVVRARLQDQRDFQPPQPQLHPATEPAAALSAQHTAVTASSSNRLNGKPAPVSASQTRRYNGIIDCAVKIWRTEGVRGLYSGFSVNLLRVVPAAVCTFFTYEYVVAHLSLT